MEYQPQLPSTDAETEMAVFNFGVRIRYWNQQQNFEHNLINPASHEKRNVRTMEDLSSERGEQLTESKLKNKASADRREVLLYFEREPGFTTSSSERVAALHYNYLAVHALLLDRKVDLEALSLALVEVDYEQDAVEEAKEQFSRFLSAEF